MTSEPNTNLNSLRVKRVKDTIFVALPRGLWRLIPGGCACACCSADGKSHEPAYWDTLAIGKSANTDYDWTWVVHYPELHGKC
jgi:hypothetical protein